MSTWRAEQRCALHAALPGAYRLLHLAPQCHSSALHLITLSKHHIPLFTHRRATATTHITESLSSGIPLPPKHTNPPLAAPQPSLIELAQSLILQYARCCVVSLGARGAVARSSSGEVGSAPAAKVSVVDTIGAGDLFSAGFLYAYLHGCPLSVCCAAGCATGAEAVQVRGTALGDAAWRRLRNTMDELVGAGVAATEGEGDADGLRDIRRPLYAWKRAASGGMPGGSISSLGSSSMGSSSSQQWLLMDTDAM